MCPILHFPDLDDSWDELQDLESMNLELHFPNLDDSGVELQVPESTNPGLHFPDLDDSWAELQVPESERNNHLKPHTGPQTASILTPGLRDHFMSRLGPPMHDGIATPVRHILSAYTEHANDPHYDTHLLVATDTARRSLEDRLQDAHAAAGMLRALAPGDRGREAELGRWLAASMVAIYGSEGVQASPSLARIADACRHGPAGELAELAAAGGDPRAVPPRDMGPGELADAAREHVITPAFDLWELFTVLLGVM